VQIWPGRRLALAQADVSITEVLSLDNAERDELMREYR
jgi:hypothetical protein